MASAAASPDASLMVKSPDAKAARGPQLLRSASPEFRAAAASVSLADFRAAAAGSPRRLEAEADQEDEEEEDADEDDDADEVDSDAGSTSWEDVTSDDDESADSSPRANLEADAAASREPPEASPAPSGQASAGTHKPQWVASNTQWVAGDAGGRKEQPGAAGGGGASAADVADGGKGVADVSTDVERDVKDVERRVEEKDSLLYSATQKFIEAEGCSEELRLELRQLSRERCMLRTIGPG
ncbi:hypothetical protein T484DRAFT_1773105 [Baffinella frigidus]|nr:hypothetical protein T484DRAFT_1773105 [Cryptophyta sp. CCMP2293]